MMIVSSLVFGSRLKVSSFKCICCKHFLNSSRHWAIAIIYAAFKGGNLGVKVAIMENSELCCIIKKKRQERKE